MGRRPPFSGIAQAVQNRDLIGLRSKTHYFRCVPRIASMAMVLISLVASGPIVAQPVDEVRHDIAASKSVQTTGASGGQKKESERRWRSCATLMYPDGGYSASELQAMLTRPENIQQLLQNVKLAWDRELVLQPAFYDEATLRKFFNGTNVAGKTPDNLFRSPDKQYVVADIKSDVLPKMVMHVESNCSEYGVGPKTFTVLGSMIIEVGTPEMTLSLVRQAFGHETANRLDPGTDQHGNNYIPRYKGSVHYWNVRKSSREGRVETAFYFRAKTPSHRESESSGEIVDDDVVTRIEMQDSDRTELESK